MPCVSKKIYHRGTEDTEMIYFCRTGRRRSSKSLSPAGTKTFPALNLSAIDRYFCFAVVSRQRKRINSLCVLRASSEAGSEIFFAVIFICD